MRHTLTSFRPATAAIAAVLVLATSPVIAQEAADPAAVPLPPVSEAAPAPAPAPEVALPVLTPQAAPAPVVPAPSQATEVVQSTPAASPEDAAPVAARAPARAQAPAVARNVPAPAPAAPVTTAPAPMVAPEAPMTTSPADMAPAPAPVVPADPGNATATDESVYWAHGGGGLLLLGGLGAWALSRRRKDATEVVRAPALAPVATSAVKPADLSFQPVAVEPAPVAAPAVAMAAATATPRAATVSTGNWSPLEEMVAAAPSPENPFLTRKARLRRANYILAHGIPEPLSSESYAAPERVEAKEFKPQQAYDFGKAQNPPRFTWRPATS